MSKEDIVDSEKIYDLIKSHLENKIPLVIGKIGANELNFLYCLDYPVQNNIKESFSFNLATGAGCYFKDQHCNSSFMIDEYLPKFMREKYLPSLKYVDVFACWNHNRSYEISLIESHNPFYLSVQLGSLEPYYFNKKWSQLLENKRVLIISPFTKSIEKQFYKRNLIWNNVIPTFTPIYLNFPLSYYLQDENNRSHLPCSSHKLLEEYIEKINSLDFDIALIGVGVYSLPLAVKCKQMGKIGFHLGGGLQILFGIKGGRWKETSFAFANESHWIYPSEEETPKYKDVCENGCYW
jgi:hypothetical protein